jgi:hypothetical protein
MRALLVCSELSVSANSTVHSTPILLVAGAVGSVFAGDEAVPGEDMAFPSSGSCVVAVSLEGVTSGSGDSLTVDASVNYYSDSGSGETFTASKTYTPGTLSAKSKTVFLDQVALGEAIRVSYTSTHSSGAGTITAYLLNN